MENAVNANDVGWDAVLRTCGIATGVRMFDGFELPKSEMKGCINFES